MITLILAIAAAIAAGKAIYGKTESVARAIVFVLLAWIAAAFAFAVINKITGMYFNISSWGLLLGSGILWIIYANK